MLIFYYTTLLNFNFYKLLCGYSALKQKTVKFIHSLICTCTTVQRNKTDVCVLALPSFFNGWISNYCNCYVFLCYAFKKSLFKYTTIDFPFILNGQCSSFYTYTIFFHPVRFVSLQLQVSFYSNFMLPCMRPTNISTK